MTGKSYIEEVTTQNQPPFVDMRVVIGKAYCNSTLVYENVPLQGKMKNKVGILIIHQVRNIPLAIDYDRRYQQLILQCTHTSHHCMFM